MKILLLTSLMRPDSGSGRCAVDLVDAIRASGHEVTILKEEDDGLEGVPILKRRVGLFRSAWRIRRYVKQCDVIHALDGYPFGLIAALANIRLNKKLVITAIGTYSVEPLYHWKTSWLVAWAYRQATNVVCISRYTRDQLLVRVRIKNISVANLGIDVRAFETVREVSDMPLMLSVGAVKRRKGYETSIRAFAKVRNRFPDLEYKIVGGTRDAHYHQLQKLVDELGCTGHAQFLGEVSDSELHRLYSRARLFVLTSVNQGHHFEGYGLVFLEAAAAGLPVIGTRGTGIEDAVKDGYNGILVGQHNEDETAQAMSQLLEDEELWRRMSENSRQWAREHDRKFMIRPYLAIYSQTQ